MAKILLSVIRALHKKNKSTYTITPATLGGTKIGKTTKTTNIDYAIDIKEERNKTLVKKLNNIIKKKREMGSRKLNL